jgi:hypothetical protein
VILKFSDDLGESQIQIYDCTGHLVDEHAVNLKKDLMELSIPSSGLLSIKEKK